MLMELLGVSITDEGASKDDSTEASLTVASRVDRKNVVFRLKNFLIVLVRFLIRV